MLKAFSRSVLTAFLLLGTEALDSIAIAAGDDTVSVTIRNVSNNRTLVISADESRAVPVAPGAYAIVSEGATIFREGANAGNFGLESLAEDGNAETLIAYLQLQPGIRQAGLFVPGRPFTVSAMPGDRLVFAAMFVESNDLFYAPSADGIALFDATGTAIDGNVSSQVMLWDAGTEVNERPGVGANQAPRQTAPNTGPAENGVVRPVADGFEYPAVADVLEVTISKE